MKINTTRNRSKRNFLYQKSLNQLPVVIHIHQPISLEAFTKVNFDCINYAVFLSIFVSLTHELHCMCIIKINQSAHKSTELKVDGWQLSESVNI